MKKHLSFHEFGKKTSCKVFPPSTGECFDLSAWGTWHALEDATVYATTGDLYHIKTKGGSTVTLRFV